MYSCPALLELDPLLEGDFYPRDVLVAVLRASTNPEQRPRIELVIASIDDPELDSIEVAIAEFRARNCGPAAAAERR
ncbi:hypothetical protein [Saccharopolyspora pogona]|uniref:hypothetical protein n=1 Tax=Saccharopolyspora pogona TaxID=333966 RepID=UPI001CC2664F|nr:hypothetical protein [Saccharopolyspora pogona]